MTHPTDDLLSVKLISPVTTSRGPTTRKIRGYNKQTTVSWETLIWKQIYFWFENIIEYERDVDVAAMKCWLLFLHSHVITHLTWHLAVYLYDRVPGRIRRASTKLRTDRYDDDRQGKQSCASFTSHSLGTKWK